MQFDPKTNKFILSTGTQFYAYSGILGMSERLTNEIDTLSYGYDSAVSLVDFEGNPKFSREELLEIADYMIDQWKKWKETIKENV